MQNFWKQLDAQTLEALTPAGLPYPGVEVIQARFRAKTARRRHWLRRGLLLAAVICLLCAGTYAAYTRWSLPAPKPITGDAVQSQQTKDYVYDSQNDVYTGQTPPEDTMTESGFTDADFMEKALAVLELLNAEADRTQMTVTHALDQRWNRSQVTVSFPLAEQEVHVTFDEADGNLLSVQNWPASNDGEGLPVMREEEALAAAEGWYQRLPYVQGYEYTYVNQIDDGAWMYSFCRPMELEVGGEIIRLYNDYEEVRITIDPRTGAFILSNSFYVPLLDDHQPGDTPLTEAEAIAIAQEQAGDYDFDEITAEVVICHPNYFGVEDAPVDYAYVSVTRLAWGVTLYDFGGEIDTMQIVYVDLYTGEILGGAMT